MNSRLQRIWQALHPRNITDALASIDQEAATDRKHVNPQHETRRVWIVLMLACVCLLMTHYLKHSSVLYELIRILEGWFSIENHQWLRDFRAHPYRQLLGYIWWGAWHLLCFLIIPMVCIKYILKQINDYLVIKKYNGDFNIIEMETFGNEVKSLEKLEHSFAHESSNLKIITDNMKDAFDTLTNTYNDVKDLSLSLLDEAFIPEKPSQTADTLAAQ